MASKFDSLRPIPRAYSGSMTSPSAPPNPMGGIELTYLSSASKSQPWGITSDDPPIANPNPNPNTNTNTTCIQPRTPLHHTIERTHFLTLYWTLLLAGWNDASTGPLLFKIQGYYGIGFTVISVLFVGSCVVSSSFLLFFLLFAFCFLLRAHGWDG
jgi:hypothetical protein